MSGGRRLGSAAGACCATLESAALVLAEAAPDAGILAGVHCVLEAHFRHWAAGADGLRSLNLIHCRTGVANRKEQLGIYGQARSLFTPIHTYLLCVARAMLNLYTR